MLMLIDYALISSILLINELTNLGASSAKLESYYLLKVFNKKI